MKQRVGLVLAWFAATALAVAVASQAVGLVGDRAVEAPIAVPVSGAAQSALGPLSTVTTNPPPSDALSTTTTRPATSSTAPPSTSTPSTASTTPPASTNTTLPPSTSTTLATSTTATTTPPLESGTFVLTGGQVTAGCTGLNTIALQGAVPVLGWSAEVEEAGPERVRVDFELQGAEEQESEVKLWCDGGRLVSEISDS